ncbi:TIGR03936 family radical SAM-associated protein [Thermobifida halotolerans]|uniref:TIGR03936 family radical SAM-associated protein n=1 Tax=Thermobifida halotolerans TaxID=483545 RepID=UPI000A4DA9BE|nr:TIGR03936 family radical SAM-associated protein [Thermobifida halotolerans]
MRVRYAKRHRMRFASHRDIARALERALRRAQVPVAFSAGFSPHPKISYTGAAPTGVASEAEYCELTLAEPMDPEQLRARLDEAMPEGIDILTVVPATAGGLADRLEASEWRIELPGVDPDDAAAAVAAFLAAERIEVERLTKKGRRRFDARSPVLRLDVDRRAATEQQETYAILRLIVRHTIPVVRPDDVVTGLRQIAELAPQSSTRMTRLAQGPLDEDSGTIADPLAADDAASETGATVVSAHAGHAPARPGSGNVSAPQGL